MEKTLNYRILSIQSHVVHGYVGNKCSVFALQTLGIDVDPICSVQFSNHTGYKYWRGERLTGDQLRELYEGLVANNLTKYSHVLTGYINGIDTLRTALKIVKELKQQNPNLQFFCDPVMGDERRLYVPEEMVALYRDEIIPHADMIFPNQTEAEFLTGMRIESESDAWQVIDVLHSRGVKAVIISSIDTPKRDEIRVLGSTRTRNGDKRFLISTERIEGYFSGTGDLFSALVTGWSSLEENLPLAVHKAVSTIRSVLLRTSLHKDIAGQEILLIQSRKDIEYPTLHGTLTVLD